MRPIPNPRPIYAPPAPPCLLRALLLLGLALASAPSLGAAQEVGLAGVLGVVASAAEGQKATPLDLFGPTGKAGAQGGGQGGAQGGGDATSGEGGGAGGAEAADSKDAAGGAKAGAASADDGARGGGTLIPQRAFMNHSSLGFASFGAYRLAATHFMVVGHSLVDRVIGNAVSDLACEWEYTDASGRTQVTHGALHADAPALSWGTWYPWYIMMLFCELQEAPLAEPGHAAGVPCDESTAGSGSGAGGEGHIERMLGPEGEGQGGGEGLLRMRLGDYILESRPDNSRLFANVPVGKAPDTPPDLVAFCGPPMFGTLQPRSVPQWVRYHDYVVGYDRLYLYDAGAFAEEAREALKGDLESGKVVVTDFSGEKLYYAWADGQLLAMHDCLFRNRGVASWVSYGDFDEYLQVKALPAPHASFKGFLKWAAAEEYSHISHGCVMYHSLCDEGHVESLWGPEQSRYAVELLPYRGEEPYCKIPGQDPNQCYDFQGHRKLLVNPLKMGSVKVHNIRGARAVHYPSEDKPYGFSVEEVRHAHFHGLMRPNKECTTQDKVTMRLESWGLGQESKIIRDPLLAETAMAARECATLGKAEGRECPAWSARP